MTGARRTSRAYVAHGARSSRRAPVHTQSAFLRRCRRCLAGCRRDRTPEGGGPVLPVSRCADRPAPSAGPPGNAGVASDSGSRGSRFCAEPGRSNAVRRAPPYPRPCASVRKAREMRRNRGQRAVAADGRGKSPDRRRGRTGPRSRPRSRPRFRPRSRRSRTAPAPPATPAGCARPGSSRRAARAPRRRPPPHSGPAGRIR